MIKWPAMHKLMQFDETRRQSKGDMNLKALTLASIVLASRHGGVRGVSLPSFFRVLLYELGGVVFERDAMQLPSDIAGIEEIVVPFLSPPNRKCPDWFLHDCEDTTANFDNLCFSVDSNTANIPAETSIIANTIQGISTQKDIRPYYLERLADALSSGKVLPKTSLFRKQHY